MTGSSSSEGVTSTTREMAGRAAALAVVLAAVWLLWSGLYKPLLLALGAFSCALVVYLSWRLRLFDYSVISVRHVWRLLSYLAWLGKEIVKSSVQVSRAVLSRDLAISPTVVELDADARHPVDLATLGNSITLTPGTLTIRIRDGRLIVHALMREGADVVMDGEMNRRVARLRER